jgi:hypothetical protein
VIQIPELIETWKIAQAMHWPTAKMTAFLRDTGVATRPTGCKRNFIVIREDFEATMPRIYAIFVRKYTAGEIGTKRRRVPKATDECAT